MTALPAARAYHATARRRTAALDTTTTGGWLYALGGVDSAGATVNTAWYAKVGLDGSVGPWQTTTPLPGGLHSASAVVFRGFLYLIGGSSGQGSPTAAGLRAAVNADGTLAPGRRSRHCQTAQPSMRCSTSGPTCMRSAAT
jgi:hypothetical protein